MRPVKTAAVVHDLSGVGRCALTVVLPVLSAMGVQACPVPTAVLSTHTGGFDGIASVDLTDLMGPYLAHWRRLNMRFDAVYSGYLANCAQAEHVLSLMRWQKCLNVVDPVMGDEGEMYSALPREIPAEMRRLCAAADVITPNLTEAALLLDEPFSAAPRTGGEVDALLRRLLALGARSVVLTSVPMEDGSMANAWMEAGGRLRGEMRFHPLPIHYPGTGDLFASVLTGALLRGEGLQAAVRRAEGYIYRAMEITNAVGSEPRMGVQFEKTLHELTFNTDCDTVKGGDTI